MDLSAIEGQQLSAVEFVHDFLQLRFEGPMLALFSWPDIFREEGSYAYGEPEYRNWLCALIGETVSAATLVEGHALELQFETGVILRTSLREEDLDGPEAGQYSATGLPEDEIFEF